MDNWLALFDGQTRYQLEINDSRVSADVLKFRGREALNEPFRWRIEFTSSQDDVAAEDVLMKYATLRMLSGRVVQGIIIAFEWLGATADQTHYSVTISSRMALLANTRRCAVYQNLSVPELVEQVLRAPVWRVRILSFVWRKATRSGNSSPSGGKATCSLSSACFLRSVSGSAPASMRSPGWTR